MAKKKSVPRVEPVAEQGTSSYSTRFDPRQRELIEGSAKRLNVTPAKLIREAAVRKAADVENAAGPARAQLQHLAKLVVEQLVNPAVQYDAVAIDPGGEEVSEERVHLTYRKSCEVRDYPPDWPDLDFRVKHASLKPVRPHDSDLTQIKRALETCGTEFVTMVLEQWSAGESGPVEYRPRIESDSLLQADDGEEA